MKEKLYRPIAIGLAVIVLLSAAGILLSGAVRVKQAGYSMNTWENVLEGKDYLESDEYRQAVSETIYEVMGVAARSSRMESGGQYDPDRIIRVRDYLESGKVYDSMPESEKTNGICYRLGDLYQWSLKGATISNRVLNEAYKPLFYGSIQEYVNQCDEEYNVVIDEIQQAMEQLKQDVTSYQQEQKEWSSEVTNVRYALYDMGSGEIYTNVAALRGADAPQTQLEDYFESFGSYYIYDSRSADVQQENVGDYYSYNTHALLTERQAHLGGEYLVYVAVDTTFPVTDELAAGAKSYEEAQELIRPSAAPMVAAGVVLLAALILFAVWLFRTLHRAAGTLLDHVSTALRICIYFVSYELVQALVRLLFGGGVIVEGVLLLAKAAVLVFLVWEGVQRQKVLEGVQAMAAGNGETSIDTEGLFRGNRQLAEAVNDLGEGLRTALQEQMKSERMKADLITNVSHDLKTPLTSVINYVDLMKREEIGNPKAQEYLNVLDQKSQRLKQLTDDLVEASRASSGNVTLNMERIDLKELLMQTSGEFEEKFAARGLKLVTTCPNYPLYVEADGRRLWRIIENLYRNVEKYAMPNTRVYLNVESGGEQVSVSMKNISEQPLNISAEELTERFIRGDESRSTEGSGLGLAIAKDLTELQKGTFQIYLDGDLFKVTISFPRVQ
ncbi:MAG: HAMP domain-containing sensor histidine kinase [Eubacteriales bacterium]|nr:HAMP domain-containing sensor histidine kinase [Eubacteriales bacterium]